VGVCEKGIEDELGFGMSMLRKLCSVVVIFEEREKWWWG
jgi:hypothetical protein